MPEFVQVFAKCAEEESRVESVVDSVHTRCTLWKTRWNEVGLLIQNVRGGTERGLGVAQNGKLVQHGWHRMTCLGFEILISMVSCYPLTRHRQQKKKNEEIKSMRHDDSTRVDPE